MRCAWCGSLMRVWDGYAMSKAHEGVIFCDVHCAGAATEVRYPQRLERVREAITRIPKEPS